jgi:hypothetical protein
MQMVSSVVLAGLLAMAPNWAIVDIPYPDTSGGSAVHATGPEAQVVDALHEYARSRSATLKKGAITDLKIEGSKATARVLMGARPETVHLEHVQHEWRVVKVDPN